MPTHVSAQTENDMLCPLAGSVSSLPGLQLLEAESWSACPLSLAGQFHSVLGAVSDADKSISDGHCLQGLDL